MRSQSKFWATLLVVSACTRTEEPCPAVPCPLGIAIEVTLTASPAGTPLTTASYRILANGSAQPCNQGPSANMCVISGSAGTYQLEISATSYQTVQRAIVAPPQSTARCTCNLPVTQRLTIAMSPTS